MGTLNKIEMIMAAVDIYAAMNNWPTEEVVQFLAQVEHESLSFTRTSEIPYSPERAYQLFRKRFGSLERARKIFSVYGSAGLFEVMYSGKNGNDKPGDGAKYIGRGYIQITGKGNYAEIQEELGVNILDNPELLEEESNAIRSALIWWNKNVHGKIKDFSDTLKVTRIINGPALYGLSDRTKKYQKWKKIYE